jgi:hypothetical protein
LSDQESKGENLSCRWSLFLGKISPQRMRARERFQ